MNKAGDMSC